MTPTELEEYLGERVGDAIVATRDEYDTFTVEVAPDRLVEVATLLRDDRNLDCNMFDCSLGVDEGDAGFSTIAVLYSTAKKHRILLKTMCEGGRDKPVAPSLVGIYPGANFMERETWDMFGIEFEGHPGLAPRILTVENFEGWPLRKDFFLATREAKPWPGLKEPAELDEDGNIIERIPGPGGAPGPTELDEIMAEQARRVNAVEVEGADEAAEVDAGGGAADGEADKAPEVEIDQETYDRLIAEGKSERIARSKAKAAFVKKQRAAEQEGGQ